MPKSTTKKSTAKTQKTATKAKSANIAKRKPRLLQVLVGLMVVLTMVFVGTIVYTKYQERDIKAKAAAFQLNPNDYVGNKNNGIRLALCKRSAKDSSGRVGLQVVGIVSRPSLLYFTSGGRHTAGMGLFNSVNATVNGKGTGAATDRTESSSWFAAGPLAYTYVTAFARTTSRAVEISYDNSENYPNSFTSSLRIPIAFLPIC